MKNLQHIRDQIAIVGMSCRFPKGVNNPESFWKLMRDGVDAITEIPTDRWDVDALYNADRAAPGKTYVRHGGFIDNVDHFEPEFFGISPREAANIDPQQRLLLEFSYEALEDAGEVPEQLSGKPVSVFVGYYIHDYAQTQLFDRNGINPYTGTGTGMSIGANRISYLFNFQGPSVALDTACSSSLVAVHLACQSLLNRESDVALAGGVNTILRPEMTIAMSKASMLSADGRCKSFDARANGFVRAEGGGIVVLKRLADALRDGNPIHAIIRSSAVNQDGRTKGISVPNGECQEKLLWEAYKIADVNPAQIQYVEAHGTGTPVGDPIEANALGAVLSVGRPEDQPCLMGSVKTNIGHTESASGVAGLIKVVLCLKHRQIPPNLHFETPNPKIRFDEYKLRVPTQLEQWPETEGPRLASLNSFGFGGTNAHLVIQEAPTQTQTATFAQIHNTDRQQPRKTAYTLPLSAHSPEALNAMAKAYCNFLVDNSSQTLLSDIVYTAATRRRHRKERLALTAYDKEEMIELLKAFLAEEKRINLAIGSINLEEPMRPAFVFTGMGPQWWAMGRQLLEQEPVYREAVERCDTLLREYTNWSLLAELTASEDQSRINETFIAQPAIFALQVALFALWQSWGVEPAVILGHSVGEVAATYAAGILSLEDAIKVIYHRSRLQHQMAGRGRMLAVGLSEAETKKLLIDYDNIAISAVNSPRSITLAGDGTALENIQKQLEARGAFTRFLQVPVPYHSPAMEPLKEELYESLRNLQPRSAKVPFYSTILAKQMEGSEMTVDYWWKNVRNPVLFKNTIEQLFEVGYTTFLEIGPHPVLSRSIIECLDKRQGTVIPSLRRRNKDESLLDEGALLLNSLGKLYASGYPVDWTRQYHEGQVVPLPSYPWQRERYWNESKEGEQLRRGRQQYSIEVGSGNLHPLLGYRLNTVQPVWNSQFRSLEYMKDHRVRGAAIYPGAGYLEMMLVAAQSVLGEESCILENVGFHEALFLAANNSVKLQTVLSDSQFNIYAQEEETTAWTHQASSKLRRYNKQGDEKKIDLQEIRDRCLEEIDSNYCYTLFNDVGLNYGPVFQGITKLWRGQKEALAQIATPQHLIETIENYTFHPAVFDACLHTLYCALSIDGGDSDMRGDVYLPVSIRQFRFYRRPSAQMWSHVVLQEQNKGIFFEGNVYIYNDEGTLVAEVLGLRCQNLNISSEAIPEKLNDWLYEYQWHNQQISQEVITPNSSKTRNLWLILTDQEGVGVRLAELLKEKDQYPVLVFPGETFERIDESSFRVNPESAEDMKELFSCGFDLDAYIGLVHLWSVGTPACETLSIEELKSSQMYGYGSALCLLHAYLDFQWQTPPRIWLITSSTQSVTGDEDLLLAQAPIWGLNRVMSNEHPETRCSVIDLSPKISEDELQLLVQEFLTDSPEDEVALRGNKRFVHRFVKLPKQDTAEEIFAVPYKLEIQRVGSLDTLRLRQSQYRELDLDQIEIQVHAVSLNSQDLVKAQGALSENAMEKSFWGRSFGMECSGTVVRTGEGVSTFKPGDRVLAFAHNSFSSHAIADQRLAVIASNLNFEEAATIPLAFLTAYYALHYLGRIKAGNRILIHPTTNCIDLAAIQIAQWAGAEVFAIIDSPEKREFLKAQGVKYIWDSQFLDFADEIMAITKGKGVDLVLSSLASEIADKSLAVLSEYGNLLQLSEISPERNNNLVNLESLHQNISVTGVNIDRLLVQKPDLVNSLLQDLIELFDNDYLKPLPNKVVPITKFREAFYDMAETKPIGKMVVSLEQRVPVAAAGQIAFNPEATYLVTGGLSGFGLALVHWLVDNGAKHLVLMSRSGASSPTAQAAVEILRNKKVKVLVAKADVSNEKQVARVLSEMQSMPPLKGIFHAAAILDDGLLKEQNLERYYSVMAPKMLGAWILHNLTLNIPLDYFVLFSSVTSVLGNHGSSNYIAANSFVDSLAYYRRKMDLPSLTINWGVVANVGLISREAVMLKHLERNGLVGLHSDLGFKLLGKFLQEQATQVTVAPIDWQQWFKFHDAGATPRFLMLVQDGQEVTPDQAVDSNVDIFITAFAQAKQADRRQVTENILRERVARVFGISPAKLDIHKTFTALGLDSLMAIEMRNQLESFGLAVSVSSLLEGTTVAGLIDQVLEKYGFAQEDVAKTPVSVKEDEANQNRWVVFPKPNPNAKVRLFCFPYAGAAPTIYYQWAEELPDSIEVCAINLPGRSQRIKEMALTSIFEMNRAMIADLLPILDKPFAFFGHCMGSIVMYEVARLLQEEYGKKPVHIFPSASMAPHLYQSPLVHEHPDPKFMEILQLLDFTNTKALVEDKEMKELMFPTLRADFEAVATYSRDFSARQSLDVPMTAFAAKRDLYAAPNAMLPWREYTKGSSQFWLLDFHHYFVETHRPFLLKVISHTLSQYIDTDSAGHLEVLPGEAEEMTSGTENRENRETVLTAIKDCKTNSDLWLDFLAPNHEAQMRLFCFPPAFGSDPYPQFLEAGLPKNIELCSIQLPGRGKRADEPFLSTIQDAVDIVTPILEDYLDKPFAFFGHCFGGIIAYEVACRLSRERNVLPAHLFCSGIAAPHMYLMPNVYLLTDDKIIEVLKVIDHPWADRLYTDQQFYQKWMPMLRADFEIMSKYQPPKKEEPLNIPITAIRGRSDLWLYFYGVDSWRDYTVNSFEVFTHLGNHFYLEEEPNFALDVINKKLQMTQVFAEG